MAWGGKAEVADGDVVYEPLPQLDRDELRRLRATIGLPEADQREPIRPRVLADRVPVPPVAATTVIDLRDAAAPRVNLVELLEEVDRKLAKLIDGGSMPVFNDFFGDALVEVQSEMGDMRQQLDDLQASLNKLARKLLG
jgi:hypothetical protein